MKNFYRYLSPFAPDYSGAAAVFLGCNALIVICDPGGCSGNVCGYDEPRFYNEKSAIYSAAMRDMDAIWGKDDRLTDKIVAAAAYAQFEMIALIGTPVVSVIATDLEALCHMIEKKTGIPTVSVNTSGLDFYDVGEKKARMVLEKRFPKKYKFEYTPLDSMPTEELLKKMTDTFWNIAQNTAASKKILIIHQNEACELLKKRLISLGCENIVTGGWFRGCDIYFRDEELFIEECMKYDVIFADPLYFDALIDFKGIKVSFPHLAVSGDLFMEQFENEDKK